MGVQVVEVAALASTTFAAIAATASWANVILMRKSLTASVLPDVHVIGMRIEPSGLVYDLAGSVTSLQFNVYNAGGGIAKGVGYMLWHGSEYVTGLVAPMIRPGQTYRIKTDMMPMGSEGLWGGIVVCLDLHNHRRTWKLPGAELTVTKGEDDDTTLSDLYRRVGATPDLAALTCKKSTVELITD